VSRIRMSALLVGTCIALAAAAAPAAASVVGSQSGDGARGAPLTLANPGAKIPIEKSTSTAGYISEKSGIKTVSTTFEVPKITSCTSSENAGMGPVVILLGQGYFVGAGAEAECQSGTTSYMIAINHNGSETHPLSVAARDKISVDISIRSKTVLVKIDDLTSGKKASQSLPKRKVTDAELGDDSLTQNSHQVPIPAFTAHQFTAVKINGKVLKDATPLVDEELVKGKTVLIEAGALNKSGDAFVMHFKHAR
jgi:Peptidase A4 family